VEVGPKFTWQRWIERYRAGRNFVTTGPLIAFDVNGEPAGKEIRVPAGQSFRARISAEVTSRVPLRKVEIVRNGHVIETREAHGDERSVRIDASVAADRSSWFAVRALGVPARGGGSQDTATRAHTTPVWVLVGGTPVLEKEDLEYALRWIDRLWALMEERDNFGPGTNRERARFTFDQARAYYRMKLEHVR
jgi:hypothetical protein